MSIFSSFFGGGPSQPRTQQVVQQTKLPEEIAPFAKEVLEDAKKQYLESIERGYDPYRGQTIAPQTQEQLAAQEGLKALVGTQRPLQEEALAQFRTGLTESFTPEVAQEYMSPYQRAVTDIEKRESQRAFESQIMPQFEKQAVQAGGMSGLGTRAGVQASELGRAQMQRLGDIEAKGLQAAYRDAQNLFQQQQARERTAAADIAGLAPAMVAGGVTEQGLLQSIGEEKQALGQQALNEAYFRHLEEQAFPQEQLAGYSGFVYGNPLMQQRTMTQTSPAAMGPSKGAQLMGLGMTAAKMYGMGGGFDPGGTFSGRQMMQKFTSKTGGRLSRKTGGGLSSLPVVYRQSEGPVLDEGEATNPLSLSEEAALRADPAPTPAHKIDRIIRSLGATSATPSEEDIREDARLTRKALKEASETERKRRLAASELRKETQLGMLKEPSFGLTEAIKAAGKGTAAGEAPESTASMLTRLFGAGAEVYDKEKAAIAKKKAELEGKRSQEEELTERSRYKENLALLGKDEKLRDLIRGLPQQKQDSLLKNAKSRADMYALYAKAQKDLSSKGTGKAFSKPLDQIIDSVKMDNNYIFDSAGNFVGGSDEVLTQGSYAHTKLYAEAEAARQAYISYLNEHGSDYSDQVKAQAAARKAINEVREKMRPIPKEYFNDVKYPIAEDIPKNQLKKGQVYRVGPRLTPSLKEWDGKGFINL